MVRAEHPPPKLKDPLLLASNSRADSTGHIADTSERFFRVEVVLWETMRGH